MKITTNNKPRDLIMFMDLTEKEKKDFDYILSDHDDPNDNAGMYEYRFFRYRGNVYDAGDMMRAPESFNGWHGYQSDTFFSGILIKYDVETDSVIVARYYC